MTTTRSLSTVFAAVSLIGVGCTTSPPSSDGGAEDARTRLDSMGVDSSPLDSAGIDSAASDVTELDTGVVETDAGATDTGVTDTGVAGDTGVRSDTGIADAMAPRDSGVGGASRVTVTLTRAGGVTGTQRINLGVPVAAGATTASTQVAVLIAGAPVATASRVLATHRDGSPRSFQVQFDAPMTATSAEVVFGMSAPSLALVAVDTLLQNEPLGSDTARTPRVWATLPSSWLVASKVAGNLVAHSDLTTAPLDAWRRRCDYGAYSSAAFAPLMGTAGSWLYDRATAFFRGYAATGTLAVLQSAYREADVYRTRILASSTVPPSTDLKYNYTQNLAIHYLLTGDDRFREAAETVAGRSTVSGYTGAYSTSFWTERSAGFGLLANVYAARVSDDRAAEFRMRAQAIVTNLVAIQNRTVDLSRAPTSKQLDAMHRCFGHTPMAHDISEYVGLDMPMAATLVCSPWMSAIAADALESYADDADATGRAAALDSIVRLGRRLAAMDNRGASGRPHYLLGVDGANAPDGFDEHWGEVAYVAAMAWHYSGRTDSALRANAMHYVDGFNTRGAVGQLRSFNWQCRSGIATPFYLR